MATYIVRKVWTGLTDEQVRENFPVFKDMPDGCGGMRVPSRSETLEDGSKVHVGISLELTKTPQETSKS